MVWHLVFMFDSSSDIYCSTYLLTSLIKNFDCEKDTHLIIYVYVICAKMRKLVLCCLCNFEAVVIDMQDPF